VARSAKPALAAVLLAVVCLSALHVVAARGARVGARHRRGPGAGRAITASAIGPGTELLRIRVPGPGGPIRADVLRIDLADPGVRVGLLDPGVLAAVAPVSAMARRAGAFAAINGDFFNIGAAGAPIGPVVSGGQLLKGPEAGRELAVGVGVDGVARIAEVWFRGSAQLPTGRRVLSDLNDANRGPKPILAPNGIGLFTSAWGAYSRTGAVRGLHSVTQVVVRGDRVVRISHRAGAGTISRGTDVLLGAGLGGRALDRLRVGQPVSISAAQGTDAAEAFQFAIGAKYRLLTNGAVSPGLPASAGQPRTAIGLADGGQVMDLVVTAGPPAIGSRRGAVPGLDLPELARFLRGIGVRDAVALDDGGSTTIVARQGGHGRLALLNRPSDGSERRVANGVGVFAVPTPGAVLHIARLAPGAVLRTATPG